MNTRKKTSRILALAFCLALLMGFAMPAMAASIVGYTTISADNTPVYNDQACTVVIGTFSKGDIVGITGQVSSAGVWIVRQQGDSTTNVATAYVKKAATAHTGSSVGGKKASEKVAAMTASAGTTATTDTGTTTTTTTSGGSAGYITNCKSYVNWRSAASASSSKLGTLSLNTVITVYEKTNGFYKVANSSGTIGYVSDKYVALGTPSASSSSSSGSGSTGTISNCNSSVNWRSGASTSSNKLGSLKKGTKVTVLGTEGDFYKISYNGKTGYVAKQFLTVSGSTASSGGSIKFDKVKVEPNTSSPTSTVKTAYTTAKGKNSDVVGYINISGTNISHPILYKSGNANYYDDHDALGNSASKGAVHSFYNVMTRNNTVTAHNMRGSNDMFHQLSHIYDKAAGHSTCQTTDYKCGASSLNSIPDVRSTGSSRTWDVYCFGYTKWEVWAMYKTEASEPTSTINNNINYLSTSTEAEINTWINTQKSRSIISGSADASDIILTLYTCGTNYDAADAQSRIYIFLKAVK